jgi:hypothetical protein
MTVRSKAELQDAIRGREREITVEGPLAKHLHHGRKLPGISRLALAVLAAAIVGIPISGAISGVAIAPIAALTGVEIALIIAAIVLGIALLKTVWRDYDEVEFDFGPPPKATFRRKSA